MRGAVWRHACGGQGAGVQRAGVGPCSGSLTVGLVPHVALDEPHVSRATQVCPMGKARPEEQCQAEVLQLEWSCGTSIRHTPQAPALSQSATSRGQGVAIGHIHAAGGGGGAGGGDGGSGHGGTSQWTR